MSRQTFHLKVPGSARRMQWAQLFFYKSEKSNSGKEYPTIPVINDNQAPLMSEIQNVECRAQTEGNKYDYGLRGEDLRGLQMQQNDTLLSVDEIGQSPLLHNEYIPVSTSSLSSSNNEPQPRQLSEHHRSVTDSSGGRPVTAGGTSGESVAGGAGGGGGAGGAGGAGGKGVRTPLYTLVAKYSEIYSVMADRERKNWFFVTFKFLRGDEVQVRYEV
eukprot:Selendium_serpulae@DN1593_c2_g1_i1.p1